MLLGNVHLSNERRELYAQYSQPTRAACGTCSCMSIDVAYELTEWSVSLFVDSIEEPVTPAKVIKKQPSKVSQSEPPRHQLKVEESDKSEDEEEPLSDISDVFNNDVPPTEESQNKPRKSLKKQDSRVAANALIDQQFAGLTDHNSDLSDWPLFAGVSSSCTAAMLALH